MTLRFGLQETTIRKIHDVLARHPEVERAILYGSRAKGNYRNGSDIDLTLRGDEHRLNTTLLFRIMRELDDLLLPYTFDLSIFHHIADTDVLDHIRRVGMTFYEKKTDTAAAAQHDRNNPAADRQ
ncbi:MAG: nucleotidyltransferase domain-containing protein [Deltaproteobacteria bacterium]|nr:nucleotidyltransferase domain-containing protein [Candidatus Anaeroferrophillacea bacterium]